MGSPPPRARRARERRSPLPFRHFDFFLRHFLLAHSWHHPLFLVVIRILYVFFCLSDFFLLFRFFRRSPHVLALNVFNRDLRRPPKQVSISRISVGFLFCFVVGNVRFCFVKQNKKEINELQNKKNLNETKTRH